MRPATDTTTDDGERDASTATDGDSGASTPIGRVRREVRANVTGGVRDVLRPAYNRIREHLPRKIVVCNGVPARQGRLLDATDVRPEFKPVAMRALRREVGEDDDVLVIGGGYGVGAVVAARRVLTGAGSVTVYEASAEHCEHVRETAEMNRVADQIDVEQVLVGEAVDVWGDTADVEVLPPDELPAVDAVYVDVEGAELSVLEGMTVRPSRLIVEFHPDRGVDREAVVTAMAEMGYGIVSDDWPNADSPEVVGVHGGRS